MEWNNGKSFCSNFVCVRPPQSSSSSSALLFNYNMDQFPGQSMMTETTTTTTKKGLVGMEGDDEQNVVGGGVVDQLKKKRLNEEQLEALERSFEEEIKLDPERKMKLSKQLGLQPRQIAVWFQNRRARWKTKQLQHLYHTLKQQFDTISNEKHNLQLEVMKLRSMLREQAMRNKEGSSMGYMDVVSGEETMVDCTSSMENRSCNNKYYMYNVEELNQIISGSSSAPPFWWDAQDDAHLPSYP